MKAQDNGSSRRERRHFSAALKAAIVKAHLVDKVPISDLCERHAITVNQFYQWQKQLFEGAAAAFETRRKSGAPDAKDRRIDARELRWTATSYSARSGAVQKHRRAPTDCLYGKDSIAQADYEGSIPFTRSFLVTWAENIAPLTIVRVC